MDENKTTSASAAPTPPKKVRRIGRVAFAVLLILAGILLLVQQFVPHFDLLSIVRFSPVLLILLGIEVLVYSANPRIQIKFDWLSVLGCGFILVVVGCSSLVPVAWSLYSPQRDYARSRYQSTLQDQFYQALNADPDLKARIRNLQIYVDFNHTESGEYTLQDGDTVSVYVELPENGYPDAVSFAADCRRIAELRRAGRCARRRLQFQKLHRQQRHRQQLFPGLPGQLCAGPHRRAAGPAGHRLLRIRRQQLQHPGRPGQRRQGGAAGAGHPGVRRQHTTAPIPATST